jgi:hypothetical protein
MSDKFILYPIVALALLTFGVAIWLLKCRIAAVKQGLSAAYFSLNRGSKLPDFLQQAEQHYLNLFEMPVLFYVVCILIFVTHTVGWVTLLLAWCYVLARAIHTYIHLTHNRVKSRRNAFLSSFVFLVMLWVIVIWQLIFN